MTMADTTLDDLVRGLADLDDPAALPAVADYLEETGHRFAASVRELADARPVVPRGARYWLVLDSRGDDGEHDPSAGHYERAQVDFDRVRRPDGPHRPYQQILACGSWWNVSAGPAGVNAHVYGETPEGREGFYDYQTFVDLPFHKQSDRALLAAFDVLRRSLAACLLGWLVEYNAVAHHLGLTAPEEITAGGEVAV
jgi:hypothetical protein